MRGLIINYDGENFIVLIDEGATMISIRELISSSYLSMERIAKSAPFTIVRKATVEELEEIERKIQEVKINNPNLYSNVMSKFKKERRSTQFRK